MGESAACRGLLIELITKYAPEGRHGLQKEVGYTGTDEQRLHKCNANL